MVHQAGGGKLKMNIIQIGDLAYETIYNDEQDNADAALAIGTNNEAVQYLRIKGYTAEDLISRKAEIENESIQPFFYVISGCIKMLRTHPFVGEVKGKEVTLNYGLGRSAIIPLADAALYHYRAAK